MTTLPFTNDSFDAVIALYSLIHVPVNDHRTVLKEFTRVYCRTETLIIEPPGRGAFELSILLSDSILRPVGTLLVSEGDVEWTGSNPDWLGMESRCAGRWQATKPLRVTWRPVVSRYERYGTYRTAMERIPSSLVPPVAVLY